MTGEIILIGRSGQVAAAIASAAAGRIVRHLGLPALDLARPGDIASLLDPVLMAAPPGSVLVNAAAYTDVNRAESEPELAAAINATAPGILSARCRQAGVAIIHLSTDYVYDGLKGGPYRESDACHPLSVYGRTKLAGDEAVMASGARHVILRTSAVFSASGHNFLRTMLRLGASRDRIAVVDDQITCPTAATDIAEAVLTIADRIGDGDTGTGVFHYCGDTPRSWAEFAADIFAAAGQKMTISRIKTEDFPTSARRPVYSVLDCSAVLQTFDLARSDYPRALANTMTMLLASR